MPNVGDTRTEIVNKNIYIADAYEPIYDQASDATIALGITMLGTVFISDRVTVALALGKVAGIAGAIASIYGFITSKRFANKVLPRYVKIKSVTYCYAMDDMGMDAKWLLVNVDLEFVY